MRHHMWTNHSFAIRNVLIALGSRVSMSVADDGIGMRINDCHKSDNLARKTYVYSCSRLEVPSPHQRSHLPRHTRSVDVRAERASPGPKQDPPAHMPRVQQVVHSASRPCSVWHIHRPCFRMSELCQRTYTHRVGVRFPEGLKLLQITLLHRVSRMTRFLHFYVFSIYNFFTARCARTHTDRHTTYLAPSLMHSS